MKKYKKGYHPWNYKQTKESHPSVAKISKHNIGRKDSEETRKRKSIAHLTSKKFQKWVHSKKRGDKISKSLKNHPVSIESRINNSIAIMKKWEDPVYRAKGSGKNSHYYIDGRDKNRGNHDYGDEFTRTFRNEIKKRDGNQCYLCKKKNIILAIHHIDYNKKHNNPKNLITLCQSCHAKTNTHRKTWQTFFESQSFIRYSPNLVEILRVREKLSDTIITE